MTVQAVGDLSVALFIGRADLEARGVDPDALDAGSVKSVALQSLYEAGLEWEGSLRMEVFASDFGLLVFAGRAAPEQCAFVFESCEELLEAVVALGDPGAEATAAYMDGWWYIFTDETCADVLSEFGSRLDCPEDLLGYLKEYGQIILDSEKTGKLRSYFV